MRNLPRDATAEEVRDAFARYGRIADVYLPKDFHTKQLKGIAFVEARRAGATPRNPRPPLKTRSGPPLLLFVPCLPMTRGEAEAQVSPAGVG